MPDATRSCAVEEDGRRIEALVTQAWQLVLATSDIQSNIDFFLAGGDSLLATQLATRVSSACGVHLPVRAIFDAPTIAGITQTTRELLSTTSASASPKPARTQRRNTSLSFSQERMWFMHALASASAAYHVPLAIRLQGQLDVAALQASLDRVVQRHDTLRTTFVGYSSGVSAQMSATLATPLSEIRLGRDAVAADLNSVRTYLTEFTNGLFDLDRGPLLRGALVHIAKHDAVLLLVTHHIVSDQWSMDVLLRELAAFYREQVSGTPPAIAPLPSSYATYTRRHRNWFDAKRRSIELAYWKQKLSGLEPVVLNADYPRPPHQSFRGAKLRLDFSSQESAALSAFGGAHRCTLAMVLMTALNVLLYRHTGSLDVTIGVPIANRHHADAESLIGTLVNTLVFRTDLSGEPSFIDAMLRVRTTALDAFAHQDTPFESIVKELQIIRDASRSPFFSVLFNMLNTPLGDVSFPRLSWSRFDFDRKASQFDLTLTVDAAYDRSICFEYSTDLFSAATIRRLASHYMTLLREMLKAPTARISAATMIDDEEQALLDGWTSGRTAPATELTVVDLLRRASKTHADAAALKIEDETFTYEELYAASDIVARAMRTRGVRRGDRIGLCLPRSVQLIIGQWAALKCGAAYVPLDPSYPRDRLEFMARDARLTLLVTDPLLTAKLGLSNDLCAHFDIEAALSSKPAGDTPDDESLDTARSDDAAYVIYTSGSTGRPKGVIVSHRAVVNFLQSMAREPGLTDTDRVLAVTTLSFDIAVLELLWPWSLGAQVILATQDEISDADALGKLIELHDITLMQATPSTWRMLIDGGWQGSIRLRALVGGETLPIELAVQLLARCSEVWNMYGPTETTVWSTCWKVESPQSRGVSLGHPIANSRVLILDERLRTCPIGVPGEIFIGGSGLADGYFDRPELTAERFVSDLSSHDPTAKLYRTGDRGRWRHDGALEHLGRLDTQVKVRGHRIELGEIEAQLGGHPNVAQVLVTTREARGGDLRLIAYIIPRGAMAETSVLRSYLRDRVPDYMLPQWFVTLDAFPTLPNGKKDLQRLPPPLQETVTATADAPRTPIETALCRIWCEVLQIDRIGVHDNFFERGGHSLLTVRVVSQIRVDLRRACTLPMMFRYPTVAALAAALGNASPLEGGAVIPLQPEGTQTPVFCICGVQVYQELAAQLAPDIPVYGVFVPVEMEYIIPSSRADEHRPTVTTLATEYLRAIQTHQPKGPYRLLGFSFGGVLAFEMAQQLKLAGEQVTFLGILDTDVPDRRGMARPGGLHHRLRMLKRRLASRLKSSVSRAAAGVSPDQRVAEARDDRYLAAIRSYVAAPYSGTAVYVRALDEPRHDWGYGWDALVSNLRTYQIPGDHLGILSHPNVGVLAEKLRRHLKP